MGRTSQAKKRAKLKKLMAKSPEKPAENSENSKSTPKELIETAIQFFQNGDIQNAKKIAKRVIKLSDDPTILNECGAVLAEVGDNKLALEAFRRSVTLAPDSGYDKYLTLGQLCSHEESLKFLTRGIELLGTEAPDEKRKLSKAYCHIAELYLTDLCMDQNAQNRCKEAVDKAILSDGNNPEGYHLAASYLISSNKFEEAKTKLREGINIWFEKHEINEEIAEITEESIAEEEKKGEDKLDVSVRMGALRLTVELEMWEEATQVARQISEEEIEDCEPRYFLAYSIFKSLPSTTDPTELAEMKSDCFEAASETKRLATEATKKRDPVAKDILEQINDLLEDLGPVDPVKNTEIGENDEWADEEESMEQD